LAHRGKMAQEVPGSYLADTAKLETECSLGRIYLLGIIVEFSVLEEEAQGYQLRWMGGVGRILIHNIGLGCLCQNNQIGFSG
jgi:hypothetical protein